MRLWACACARVGITKKKNRKKWPKNKYDRLRSSKIAQNYYCTRIRQQFWWYHVCMWDIRAQHSHGQSVQFALTDYLCFAMRNYSASHGEAAIYHAIRKTLKFMALHSQNDLCIKIHRQEYYKIPRWIVIIPRSAKDPQIIWPPTLLPYPENKNITQMQDERARNRKRKQNLRTTTQLISFWKQK